MGKPALTPRIDDMGAPDWHRFRNMFGRNVVHEVKTIPETDGPACGQHPLIGRR